MAGFLRRFTSMPDAATIEGDPGLLAIAVRNLVDNAMRYTPPGSTITIGVRADADGVSLAVSDDGPGVSPLDLPRLGKRFYRSQDNTTEGNGLGLAIVTRIAELHGARLVCANPPTGGFVARIVGLANGHGRHPDTPSAGVMPAVDDKNASRR